MDAILRAAFIYFALLIIMRMAGHRTLSEMTSFDFILLLIISETTQQALIGEDFSVTYAILAILTLIGLDVALGYFKSKSKTLNRLLEGTPTVLMRGGRMKREIMDNERVDDDDILQAARQSHGISTMDEIDTAVLEKSGGISIIPKQQPT